MAEAMVSVLRHKSVSTELRDWLAEIKNITNRARRAM